MVATVLAATTIFGFPLVVAALRRFSRHSPNSRSVRYDFHRGEAPEQEISTTYPCGSQIVGLPPCSTEYTQCREIRSVLASLCDGADAQSLFALTKRGRRFAVASVLVKTEVGVADAWVREGMTKAEADALIAQIVAAAEAVEVSIALLERRLADALAINVACDLPPPFGLLQVAETLGLGPLHPESTSPLAMVEALLAELPPEWTSTAAAQSAHRASAEWEQKYETVATWFEAGGAVEDLLRPLRTRKRRIEAVSTQLLPARRTFWAERCAWMAATLKEGADEGDNTWSEFALVARDLVGESLLDGIPLARRIAAATVEAFEQR